MAFTGPAVGKRYKIKHVKSGRYLAHAQLAKGQVYEYVFYPTSADPDYFMVLIWGSPHLECLKSVDGESLFTSLSPVKPESGGQTENTVQDEKKAIFELEAVGDNFLFRHPDTDTYLHSWVRNADFTLLRAGSREQAAGDVFALEETGTYDAVVKAWEEAKSITGAIPSPPKLTSLNKPADDYPTDPKEGPLTGKTVVPWFLVERDGTHNADWQAFNTPYYVIDRHSRWHLEKFQVYANNTTESREWSTTVGVTKTESTEIDRTLNMSVTAEAGFAFEGISAGVSTTVSKGLDVRCVKATETSWTGTYKESKQIAPVGGDEAIGTWLRHDQYRIYRADGQHLLIPFEVVDPTPHQDSYTDKA
ncbi:hypothetical protein [Streptosporangium jomthongense]|uniref:Insecticidal crystal toxin domain-containing protein n=1 Tax=Streptosporangium jomthongense TaxID=1193683 RepID=A0ABV8EVY5_9ACTN